MTDEQILATLTDILRDLLGDDSIALGMMTLRQDIPGWDSFNYVYFIVAAETRFQVKFSVAEVESFPSIGAIVTRIRTLLTERSA